MMKKLCLYPYFLPIYFYLVIFLSLVPLTFAEVKWVNIEGMASMENVTKQEARRLAIEDGMRRAIEEVTGVHMIAETLIINHKLLGDIIKTLPYGKVIEKNILKEDVEKLFKEDLTTPSLVYKVNMEVKVATEKGKKDPYFNLKASLNRTVFKEGDEMQMRISSSRDCYLTVFNLLEDEKVIRLIPNTYKENNFLKANESFLFPSPEDKEKGIYLIAHLPQGKENTIETMYILAFKEPFHFSSEHIKEGILGVYDGSTAFIKDLLIDLVEIPLSERVEQFLQYSISK